MAEPPAPASPTTMKNAPHDFITILLESEHNDYRMSEQDPRQWRAVAEDLALADQEALRWRVGMG